MSSINSNNESSQPSARTCHEESRDFNQKEYKKKSNICFEQDNNSNNFSKHLVTDYTYKHKIIWKNVIFYLILHILGVWGFCIVISGGIGWKPFLWTYIIYFLGGNAVTIGAHRLYSHRSFKARPLLRATVVLCQTLAGQNSVLTWCRDHRLHHRYSETDGDPHNSKRGFFFSHIGWLMSKKHPHVIQFGKKLDLNDLRSDWMIMFQYKYFLYLYFSLAVFIPVAVPYYYMGESMKNSFLVCYCARYVYQLNATWLVNSAAHLYGTRPYDKKIQPVESWFVSLVTNGEGWHNYHHAFPWDYKAAELYMHFNISARIIRLLEKMGLAYDLKSADPEMVERRIIKTGDGTHYILGNDEDKLAVTALGPLHPLNPTYNVMYKVPEV